MECRATKDIKKFLENFILILDLNKINLDEIIEDILQKILDVNESKINQDQARTDKISFDQARSALFTHDQGMIIRPVFVIFCCNILILIGLKCTTNV